MRSAMLGRGGAMPEYLPACSCAHRRPLVIGVGKGFALPALRTVRAIFSHTALQSAVSSSRLSRRDPGRVKREQPLVCEEGRGPAPMVVPTEPEARPLLL